jgi:hypothetical protein
MKVEGGEPEVKIERKVIWLGLKWMKWNVRKWVKEKRCGKEP